MKTTLYCLLIALALRFAWSQTVEIQNDFRPVENADRVLLLRGKVAREWRNWLAIEAQNGREWRVNGFDPCYTHIICDYKPLFRQTPTGQWEIIFVSPIASKLP